MTWPEAIVFVSVTLASLVVLWVYGLVLDRLIRSTGVRWHRFGLLARIDAWNRGVMHGYCPDRRRHFSASLTWWHHYHHRLEPEREPAGCRCGAIFEDYGTVFGGRNIYGEDLSWSVLCQSCWLTTTAHETRGQALDAWEAREVTSLRGAA